MFPVLQKRHGVMQVPDHWLNLVPLLKDFPMPQGDMRILQQVGVPECFAQEFSQETRISIPGELMDLFCGPLVRPRPLFRATKLEEFLDTPAELWCKGEFIGSATGSHKLNTAAAQVLYAKKAGFRRIVTETGAGQWGTAVACAGAMLGIPVRIYWVRAMHKVKPERRTFMELYGAEVFASPSRQTDCGRKLLAQNKNHPGSLGIAISEGLEDAKNHPGSCYVLGSVLNHVLLHQSIIGLEAKAQLEKLGRYPDRIVSCFGGGSNFGGTAIPYLYDVLTNSPSPAIQFIAAQSETAPNLTGEYRYDYADHSGLTPRLKMRTLGHQKEMSPIFGDGLRYHGASPLISYLMELRPGLIQPMIFPMDEKEIARAGKLFLKYEGHMLAFESLYSVAAAIRLAEQAKEEGLRRVILFNASGDGRLDMKAYREKCLKK